MHIPLRFRGTGVDTPFPVRTMREVRNRDD